MTLGGVALCRAAAVTLATGTALVLLSSAGAAANVGVTAIDCAGHPRKIAIQNAGDAAQNLAGWKLQSDQPDEVFDLSVAGTLGPGELMFVFNGHLSPLVPEQSGGSWIYPWNPGSFDWAINEDGTDFIRIVNAGGNEVSRMPCPIPPVTPSPQPTQAPGPQTTQPPADTNTGGSNTAGGTQPGGAAQNVSGPSNTGPARGTQVAAQARGTGTTGEVFGPPLPPGAEAALPVGGGPPLAGGSLPLPLMSLLAGAMLTLGGLLMVGLAARRPGRDA